MACKCGDLLAERGIMVSYETVRRWVNHFGPLIAADLGKRRPKPHTTWHLDEVYLKIAGRMVYLWRAVDAEGEVLDVLVQSRRNKRSHLIERGRQVAEDSEAPHQTKSKRRS
jgi:transposase-like protein